MYKAVTPQMFGHAVKVLRTARNLSQMELANKCGMTSGGMSLIERGVKNPGWDSVDSIARALDCTVSTLFRLAEDDLAGTLLEVGDDR